MRPDPAEIVTRRRDDRKTGPTPRTSPNDDDHAAAAGAARDRHGPGSREALGAAEKTADAFPFQACKMLHEAAELSLKALLIAQGRPVRYMHDLADLWDDVEADGADRIGAERDDGKLQKLLEYATEWKCDRPDDLVSDEDCPALRRLAEDVFNHAERRVRRASTDRSGRFGPIARIGPGQRATIVSAVSGRRALTRPRSRVYRGAVSAVARSAERRE